MKPLKDISVPETESALFECEFSIPDVKVDWTVNGEKIEASPKYVVISDGPKHSLDVAKCRPKDQGEITCCYGDHTTKANLTVEGNEISMFDKLTLFFWILVNRYFWQTLKHRYNAT